MQTRPFILAASAAVMALAIAACDKNTPTGPKPKTETSRPSSGSVGGPASTSGGLKGDPAGGTAGGAATASTPEGMPPGAGISKTDQGGLASRPTDDPQSGSESRPNTQQK